MANNNPNEQWHGDKEVTDFLSSRQWPTGMQKTILAGIRSSPLRFFIIDDSGSV
jgi:hypothetical protein